MVLKQIVVYVLKDYNLKRNIARRIDESKDISTIQKKKHKFIALFNTLLEKKSLFNINVNIHIL